MCGEALVKLIQIIDATGRTVSARELQALYDSVKKLHVGWCGAELKKMPKLHLLFHLVERVREQGSPQVYATWQDESLNRTLRDIGSAAHRRVWEIRIFDRFAQTEQKRNKRPRP